MKEERAIMDAKVEAEAQRWAMEAEMASKMEQQRLEAERLRQEVAEARVRSEERRLPALELRLQSMHASKLLVDEELYKLEDIIADSLEEDEGGGGGGGQAAKLLALSDRMAGDAALARQLRRKF